MLSRPTAQHMLLPSASDARGFKKMPLISSVTKNTAILTASNGIRVFLQALSFLLITRILSTSDYGAFITILAIAGTAATLSGFGSHVLLVRDTAKRQADFSASWGIALASILYSAPILLGISYIFSPFFIPSEVPLQIYIPIGIAEIFLWPLANICACAYQAHERMLKYSLMLLLPPVLRCIIAIVFMLSVKQSLLISWSHLYLTAAFISTAICLLSVYKDLGTPIWPTLRTIINRSKESVAFSASSLAQKVFIDADKIMLSNAVSTTVTGFYSAGYRLIDFALVPIYAFLGAKAPQMFRESENRIGNTGRIRQLIISTTLIACCCSLFLFFSSDFIPRILGQGYIDSVTVVRFLAFLPLICAPRLATQYYLSSIGCQNLCMKAILLGGFINILLNFYLIPGYGWRGAIAATYVAEVCTGMTMLFYTFQTSKQTRHKGIVQ